MFQTVNESAFRDAFRNCGRGDQFSYEALGCLFEYLEEIEGGDNADNGGMELDVIALCCDYAEGSADEIASDYSIDLSDCDDDEKEDAVREYLENHTSIVGETSTGFVYAKF